MYAVPTVTVERRSKTRKTPVTTSTPMQTLTSARNSGAICAPDFGRRLAEAQRRRDDDEIHQLPPTQTPAASACIV